MQDFLADVLLIGSCLFKCFSSVYKCFIPLLFFDRHWCPWDDNCDIGSGQTAECGKKSYEGSHSFCVALNLVCKLNFFYSLWSFFLKGLFTGIVAASALCSLFAVHTCNSHVAQYCTEYGGKSKGRA